MDGTRFRPQCRRGTQTRWPLAGAGIRPRNSRCRVTVLNRGPGVRAPAKLHESLRQAIGHHDAQIARSYIRRQWLDAEAITWAAQGIEASDALAWKELGLSPTEAGRQEVCGMNAIRTAKAWWQAGIPFAEFAECIRSGLTPNEAAVQRAARRQPRDP